MVIVIFFFFFWGGGSKACLGPFPVQTPGCFSPVCFGLVILAWVISVLFRAGLFWPNFGGTFQHKL